MIPRADKTERNQIIYKLRQNGYKLQDIADLYGINKERVRQICLKEERYIEREKYKYRYGTLQHIKAVRHEISLCKLYREHYNNKQADELIQRLETYLSVIEEV